MDHWQRFTEERGWYVRGRPVRVGPTGLPGTWRPSTPEFERLFPELAGLLREAHVTPVHVADTELVLFSWPATDAFPAWLCHPPRREVELVLFPEHIELLHSFGGIVERSSERLDSWMLNHDEVLTVGEAEGDASVLLDYDALFPDERVPIDVTDYYCVARESNGNRTLCQRNTGRVLLFAPDHCFEHVRPIPGFPEYTLYDLDGAPDFRRFVETLASQWRTGLSAES